MAALNVDAIFIVFSIRFLHNDAIETNNSTLSDYLSG